MANGDQFDNLNVVPSADEGLISLPPNTNGDNVASQVDIATIGAFNPSGQQVPSSDVAFIQSQLDPLGGQPVAVAGATNELFSPGFNRPLRVGGTSGQLTGSRDIFVAQNNAFPFALLEQRRAAQQAAARKRAADLSKFQFPKAPLSDDPRFNLSLERRANDLIKTFSARAQREFGSSEAALAALTNPNLVQKTQIGREFAESFAALEIMAKEGDQVVGLMAEVESAIEKGDKFVSEDTQKIFNDFKRLTGDFEGGDIEALAGFRNKLLDLQTSQTIDQFFKDNDTLKNITGDIIKTAGISEQDSGQFIKTKRFTKDFESGARAQARAIKNNPAFRNRNITEDEIFNRIMTLKGKFSDQDTFVVGSRKPILKGFNKKEDVPVSRQNKVIGTKDGVQFNSSLSVPFSSKAKEKPVKIDGLVVVDDDGKLTTRSGTVDFVPIENHVIDAGGIKRTVTSGRILDEDGEIQEEVLIDFNNARSTLSAISRDASNSVSAFEEASNVPKRNTQLVDDSNVQGQFFEAFVESGEENVNDFIRKLSEQNGVDVVLNDESRKVINSIDFAKEAKRQQDLKKRGK